MAFAIRTSFDAQKTRIKFKSIERGSMNERTSLYNRKEEKSNSQVQQAGRVYTTRQQQQTTELVDANDLFFFHFNFFRCFSSFILLLFFAARNTNRTQINTKWTITTTIVFS